MLKVELSGQVTCPPQRQKIIQALTTLYESAYNIKIIKIILY